jgi:hypothetical protein
VTPLPRYVAGSIDRRDFAIDGCTFRVERGQDWREVGFYGEGRDGDSVPSTMREPEVLAKLLAGFPNLQQKWLGWSTDSDEVLEQIERMLLERSGGYRGIHRQVSNNQDAAVGVLALPLVPKMTRNIYLSGPGPSVSINVSLSGDGTLLGTDEHIPAAKLPAFLAATLASLGPNDVRVVDNP